MIRKAVASDVPQLAEWMRKLIAHVQTTSHDPYVSNLDDGHEADFEPWFLKAVTSDSTIIYIAEESEPAGCIMGSITGPFLKASAIKRIGLIELCWVEPAYRRKGIARSLCTHIEDWFKTAGIQYIDLQYLVGNHEAELSWTKLGFQPYRIVCRKEI